MNRKINKNNVAGIKGVSFNKRAGKWTAQIQVRGHKMGLGYFHTKQGAAVAYKSAALEHFGEFARTG